MIIKKVAYCKDCGKPAKYHDPYSQCEDCWEEWWSAEDKGKDLAKRPKASKKWDDE